MKKFILFLFASLFIASMIWLWGSRVTANTHRYVYDLPFKNGSSYRVVQGYGGLFSHRHSAAIDFGMPEGTPVYAARGGYVFAYKDEHNEGGPYPSLKRKANFIMIQHADGSLGCYWHLKFNGVVAKCGKIAKGQLIGYSGNTGFTLSPHLHFSVKRKLGYEKGAFVKTLFSTTKGPCFLRAGFSYKHP